LLIERLVAENGIVINEEDITVEVELVKEGYLNDDDWRAALEQLGYTEESYRAELRLGLLYQALGEVAPDAIPQLEEESSAQARTLAWLRAVRDRADIVIARE
jgi:foldase protein PrsA